MAKIKKKDHKKLSKARAVKHIGASRSSKVASTGLIRRWFIRFSTMVCLCTLGFFAFHMRASIMSCLPSLSWLEETEFSVNREIRHLELEGEFEYVEKTQLHELLTQYLEQGFFKTDINTLKIALEAHPWIDHVNISRHWPDTLRVNVLEQQAIARWDEVGFLNQRGEVILIDGHQDLEHLPLLSSNDRFSRDVMQQYLRVNQLLWESELTLKELHLNDTLAWTLVLTPQIKVRLGKDKILDKLQALLYAKQHHLNKKFSSIALIDMRYEKGFAVRMQEEVLVTINQP